MDGNGVTLTLRKAVISIPVELINPFLDVCLPVDELQPESQIESDAVDHDPGSHFKLNMMTSPFSVTILGVEDVFPQIISSKISHGEEHLILTPLEDPISIVLKMEIYRGGELLSHSSFETPLQAFGQVLLYLWIYL